MQKKIIITLVSLVVLVGIYYVITGARSNPTPIYSPTSSTGTNEYSPSTSDNESNITPTSEATITPSTATKNVTVDIRNFSFTPATLTITRGTKVTWTNHDTVAHTVTSDSGSLLDSPAIPPGESFSFTFTGDGVTEYHCTPHPKMKGSVTISSN